MEIEIENKCFEYEIWAAWDGGCLRYATLQMGIHTQSKWTKKNIQFITFLHISQYAASAK